MDKILKKYSFLILQVTIFLLAFTAILGKVITLPSTVLVFYRMLIAFLGLIIFSFIFYENKKLKTKTIIKLIFIGFFVGAHWIFFFESIKLTNASIALICLSTSSLFASFLEPLILKRKLKLYELIISLIIVLAFLLMKETSNFHNFNKGLIIGLISALFATIFTILNKTYVNKISGVQISIYEMLGGVIFTLLYFFISNDYNYREYLYLSKNDLIYLLILGLICTSLLYVISVNILKYIPPFTVIMNFNLEPVYGIILAVIIFPDEIMNKYFYISSILILFGVFLNTYLKHIKRD